VSQDPVDDVLILNASDDFDGPTAAITNFNIDIEYSFESLGPCHRGMPFSGLENFSIGNSVHSFATFGRGDLPTLSVVRCQYTVIAREIDPRLGNQSELGAKRF
jgi:hypothetical protein